MSSHQSLTMKLAAALLLLAAAAPIATTTEARAPSQVAAEKMNNKIGQCESPEPSENASAVQQALAAIAIASAKAKEARGLAWKLKAEQDPDSGALADCLRSCAQMYSTAYDSLQTSEQILKGVAEPDRELMLELTAAADSVMTCSDDLDEQAELESPLFDVNGELGTLVNDCLTLGTSLELYLINNY